MRRRGGFTLLEVLLALGLLVLLLGVMFQFYYNAMTSRQKGISSVRESYMARTILRQITDEIRQSGGFVPGFGPGVVGDRYELAMQTTAIPNRELFRPRLVTDRPLPGQHDIKQVRYFIAWDKDVTDANGVPLSLGLVRQELKTLRQTNIIIDEEGREMLAGEEDQDAEQSFKLQLYAPEIKYLEFRYYDGAAWHKDWKISGGNALPQMVRVTLGYQTQIPVDEDSGLEDEDFGLNEEETIFPPRSYTTYVRCMQTDTFFGSRMTRAAADLAEGGI